MAASGDERDVRDDARREMRDFLSTRRDRITPRQAGLPDYGGERRRVPGLRREEVALLAGVSTDYYTRLERGEESSRPVDRPGPLITRRLPDPAGWVAR